MKVERRTAFLHDVNVVKAFESLEAKLLLLPLMMGLQPRFYVLIPLAAESKQTL